MKLMMEPTRLPFRKEEFDVVYHFYLCEDSGERFTDDALDALNLNQVYNQYREKYGIPFPDEIQSVREQYGVSASKMSVILGFGANQYRLYEAGEIPSVANGRLILAIKEPSDFMKQVKASEHLLSSSDVSKFVQRAEKLVEHQNMNMWEYLLAKQITHDALPSEYSGYHKLDFQRVAQVISFFSQVEGVTKTKLNKLLFYTDFGCYKRTGHSMTGLEYRAITYGPVPAEYDKLYMKLQEDGLVSIEHRSVRDYVAECFSGLHPFDASGFTVDELSVMEQVRASFGAATTSELVELSHQEGAWSENQESRSLISYQKHAFSLRHFN